MAYKKGKRSQRRRYVKRGARRYARKRRSGRVMVSRRTPWPHTANTSVMYSTLRDFTVSMGNSQSGIRTWRLNSIFDPEVSTTPDFGPTGVPEWSRLYKRYCVFRADVVIDCFVPNGSSATDDFSGYIFCAPRGSTGASPFNIIGGVDGVIRAPFTTYKAFTINQGNRGVVRLRRTVSIPVVEGRKIYPEEDYCGSITPTSGTNPSLMPLLYVGWASTNLVASDRTMSMTVRIKYYVKLFDRATATADTVDEV